MFRIGEILESDISQPQLTENKIRPSTNVIRLAIHLYNNNTEPTI